MVSKIPGDEISAFVVVQCLAGMCVPKPGDQMVCVTNT